MIQVSVFQELTTKYPTWDLLEAYLKSEEGGSLRCVGEGRLRVLRYVKGTSNLALPHVRWMRSVVWDTDVNRPVSVAPPKAEKTPIPTGESSCFTHVQDFLEGTMINVFCTVDAPDTLQISTRTQIGAKGSFYSNRSFGELFEDGLAAMGLSKLNLLEILGKPTESQSSVFMSLLLQHPEHRVVARIRSPRVWYISSGTVSTDGMVSVSDSLAVPTRALRAPHSYPITGFKTEADLDVFFRGVQEEKGWYWQGLVFKNAEGHRWRFRNPQYLYLRGLRGAEATSLERFLRLRAETKMKEYLKHYAEDRDLFWKLEDQLRQATSNVYQAYCDVHKSHTKKFTELPKEIQPCVFRLHAHFLEHLKPQNESIHLKDAIHLVNNLEVYEQKRLLSTLA